MARTLTGDWGQQCHEIEGMSHQPARRAYRSLRQMTLAVTMFALFAVLSFAQSPSTGSDGAGSASDAATLVQAGTISGTVLDKDGAAIPNAAVLLTEGSWSLQSVSGGDGSFAFKDVPAGSFYLSVSASGFAAQHQSGFLQSGEVDVIPHLQLVVATTIEVNVTQTREEIAEDQIHVEEKQRLFGVVPNYYVSYVPDAARPAQPAPEVSAGLEVRRKSICLRDFRSDCRDRAGQQFFQRLWTGSLTRNALARPMPTLFLGLSSETRFSPLF